MRSTLIGLFIQRALPRVLSLVLILGRRRNILPVVLRQVWPTANTWMRLLFALLAGDGLLAQLNRWHHGLLVIHVDLVAEDDDGFFNYFRFGELAGDAHLLLRVIDSVIAILLFDIVVGCLLTVEREHAPDSRSVSITGLVAHLDVFIAAYG